MHDTQTFLSRYRMHHFPHSDERFAALDKGAAVLHSGPSASPAQNPCSHVLGIYRVRARILAKRDTQYTRGVLANVIALRGELEKTPDEPCQVWIFTKPPPFNFRVFEAPESKRILGRTLGIDPRLVDPQSTP
jgi:hypothetical protein